jgi:putative FmdB family regulatory protein
MPKYAFECQECHVRFERTLKMGEHTTHPCPSCDDEAPRLFTAEGFGFAFDKGAGAPANSGVHDLDYPTADKAVGRSADERWSLLDDRRKVKETARAQGNTQALIRHAGPGYIAYEPMTPTGREARRKLAKAALGAQKAVRGGSGT